MKPAEQLIDVQAKLSSQKLEKEMRAAELIAANLELVFQNGEKEKRAAELIIANKELLFQNEQKEKRAAELIIANKELAFQNAEKEKRAEELLIANKELAFQNAEKEKRANELLAAHAELLLEHKKTEKSATALGLAVQELAAKNKEKEIQAAELIIAIRDLKISEEQIIEINKELEAFSYSVSHDLRSPLRAVNGYSKMLKTGFASELNEEANRLIDNIGLNAKKMGQLIDDLLSFSRIGRRELVKANISMQQLVSTICDEFKKEHNNRAIEFYINDLLPAKGDHVALKQVWENLISNAVKYSHAKNPAVIEIDSIIDGDHVRYTIKDNGAGFDMRYAGKLFGVFQRLHGDDEFEGTGVGLAIVYRIITKHAGTVTGKGRVNEGAEFSFTLNKTECQTV